MMSVPIYIGFGRGNAPAMIIPKSAPPPKPDMMMPNAAAPSAYWVSAKTGIPIVSGPLSKKLIIIETINTLRIRLSFQIKLNPSRIDDKTD